MRELHKQIPGRKSFWADSTNTKIPKKKTTWHSLKKKKKKKKGMERMRGIVQRKEFMQLMGLP